MERRTFVTITICFLIFWGWQKLYIEPKLPKTPPPGSAPSAQTATPDQTATGEATPAALGAPTAGSPVNVAAQTPLQTETLTAATGSVAVTNGSAVLGDWKLKSYHQNVTTPGAPLKAVDFESVTQAPAQLELAFDKPEFAYLAGVRGKMTRTPDGVSWVYEDDKIKIVREVHAKDAQPWLDVRVRAEFKGVKAGAAFISLRSNSQDKDPEAQDRQLLYWANQNIERVRLKDVALKEAPAPVKWIGAQNRYFLLAAVAGDEVIAKGLVQPLGPWQGRASLVFPVTENVVTVPLRVYFGPKELDLLRAVTPTLDHTVDFGWFTLFAYPLLRIMKTLYEVFHNYGVAIILLTLFVKLLTYPLTYKSMKSMKEMAKIQPQLTRIREKYKDDREALNREMLTLMRSHGYNPMAGCLPILVQMPVFFALYRVLYSSIELYQAPFMLWIHDLSEKDPFYVTPVLLAITMFVQQKLTPNTSTDPAQQKMMQVMPLIFGAMMISLPAGLTLYMLVNALSSIVQQAILNKKFNASTQPARA